MTSTPKPVLAALRRLASSLTSVADEYVSDASLQKAVLGSMPGCTDGEIMYAITTEHPKLSAAIRQACVVPETYFCRSPMDFALVTRHLLARDTSQIRAWSAACCTGEEAYTLAACLIAAGCVLPDVLATDLLPQHIATAQQASYGRWSVRGPELFPLLAQGADGSIAIRHDVRSCVRFAVHNLTQTLPERADFDVILCRNTLMYLREEDRKVAIQKLADALKPGGLLVMAPMDFNPSELPKNLISTGIDGVQGFTRRTAKPVVQPVPAANTPQPPPTPPEPKLLPPGEGARTPIASHLLALEHLEAGRTTSALLLLGTLCSSWAKYLPAQMELALLLQATGDIRQAITLVRGILLATQSLPGDHEIAGPETLPVRYYRTAAWALLNNHGASDE